MAKATKTVSIIARYIHKDIETGKPNGTVTYLIRASNGIDTYCTTIINGEASGCSCPAKGNCYHKNQLAEREMWIAYRASVAKKLAAQYMTVEIVEQVAEQLVETVAQDVVSPLGVKAIKGTLRVKGDPIVKKDTSVLNGAQQSAGLLSILPSRQVAKAS